MTVQSINVATEIPLPRKGIPGQGKVIEVIISRPKPGQFASAVSLATRAYDLFERHGARNCRLLLQGAAGSLADSLAGVMEFENMRALGKAANALTTDLEAASILELVQSSDSPVVTISHDIYTEITL